MSCGCMNQKMGKGHEQKNMTGEGSHALEVLNERYAKGEMNREEYKRIREDIMAGD